MKRLSAAMLLAVSTIALTLPGSVMAGAGFANCEYDSTNHKVTVTISGEYNAHLSRDTAGHIALDDIWCDGAATVTNTDSVVVTGDSMGQTFWIELADGGFRPGRTNESGKSDEIEFTVDLGATPFGQVDSVAVLGTDAVQKIRIGRTDSNSRRINLNAGERRGVDADVFMTAVERVIVFSLGGNDIIRAVGKAGTGPNPFDLFTLVDGGEGNDWLGGGSGPDTLYGGPGLDEVYGNGNIDQIQLNDGAPGDIGAGGDGNDTCTVDPGDTCTT